MRSGTRPSAGSALAGAIGGMLAALAGVPGEVIRLGDLGEQYAMTNFTYQQEEDADLVGFEYLTEAGYSAAEGAESYTVLRRLYGDRGGIFATHPTSSERRAQILRLAGAENAREGRVGKRDYDVATRRLREAALDWYEDNGRPNEARQVRRNLAGGRRKRAGS